MNLVCKVCDGNDFVMDGEYMVCQTCGTKYTIETARKLLGAQTPQATSRNHTQLEDFTIRAGVLFGYTGISRVVEIPDVVLDIAEQAFSGSAGFAKGEKTHLRVNEKRVNLFTEDLSTSLMKGAGRHA